LPVHNSEISEIFNDMADLLEIQGSNTFRVRAYRNAARTIENLSRSAVDMVNQDEDLTELKGIGKDLAKKIKEIVETGELSMLEDLKKEIPFELSDFMDIPGIGPKRVHAIYEELGVKSLDELKKAAEKHRIQEIGGFGEKTEKIILEGLKKADKTEKRLKLSIADEIATPLLEYLRKAEGVKEVIVAGSYRRRKETVGDLDILVSHKKNSDMMEHFIKYEDVRKVISSGKTRSSVLLRSGLQVDLRSVAEVSCGAALHYFTGSKAHNIAIRKIGQSKGLKINEYGIFKGKKRIAGKTEEEVFRSVGLPYIQPELRENRGEIEAAKNKKLPSLVKLKDIRGDLHSHTNRTDGNFSLEEMAKGAKERGYEYLAITDHSKHVTVAGGMDSKELSEQIREIDKLNDKIDGITILKSIELDILEDGTLDLPNDILKELDFVYCSVHYKFNLSREKQTERIIRAMDNPYFNILAHPTGRLIGKRDPYEVDMEQLMKAAKERGCFMEINSNPERLDLSDIHTKMAKDMRIKISISTDAHNITDFDYIRFGICQGRRGWLEKQDVLNTRGLDELKKLINR